LKSIKFSLGILYSSLGKVIKTRKQLPSERRRLLFILWRGFWGTKQFVAWEERRSALDRPAKDLSLGLGDFSMELSEFTQEVVLMDNRLFLGLF
jgi:hypothetical protein